jgi:hypothetical protein
MAYLRSDIRTRVRDYLDESVADVWSDTQLNRYITEELNSLPSKNIFNEDIQTTNLEDGVTSYSLPSLTYKVERVEKNEGTTTDPIWDLIHGWDTYDGSLMLSWTPSTDDQIRIFIKKFFTVPTDDVTAMDIPDDKSEILVWGVVLRAYKQLIGHLKRSVTWDTVTKPGDLSIPVIQSWIRDARSEYVNLIKQHSKVPRPRDIDLVS